jgi:hypothetical protein
MVPMTASSREACRVAVRSTLRCTGLGSVGRLRNPAVNGRKILAGLAEAPYAQSRARGGFHETRAARELAWRLHFRAARSINTRIGGFSLRDLHVRSRQQRGTGGPINSHTGTLPVRASAENEHCRPASGCTRHEPLGCGSARAILQRVAVRAGEPQIRWATRTKGCR